MTRKEIYKYAREELNLGWWKARKLSKEIEPFSDYQWSTLEEVFDVVFSFVDRYEIDKEQVFKILGIFQEEKKNEKGE